MKSRRNNETWKEFNMKRVQHKKSTARRECNRKRLHSEKSATWKKCYTRKVHHGKSNNGKSASRKRCNEKIVQHKQSIKADQNLEKVLKRITRRPQRASNTGDPNWVLSMEFHIMKNIKQPFSPEKYWIINTKYFWIFDYLQLTIYTRSKIKIQIFTNVL